MLYTFRRMFLHRFLSSDYTVCILELQLHLKSLRFHRFNKNISISFPRYPLTKKKKYHLENIIPRLQKLPQSCLKITQTYHPFTHHRALSEQSRETNHDDLCTLRQKWVSLPRVVSNISRSENWCRFPCCSIFRLFSPYPERRPSDT
uniref:(northern house mosquito) hypothetical protein n=1 Tax=Culex pipiens TaxID=7175 RepID=A0A8D8BSS0_CULPI